MRKLARLLAEQKYERSEGYQRKRRGDRSGRSKRGSDIMSVLDWLKDKKSTKVNKQSLPTERAMEGVMEGVELFRGMFNNYLQRMRVDLPKFASFLDQYFGPDEIDMLALIAAEKMSLTQSDGEEHSYVFNTRQKTVSAGNPVCYQICTLPVAMDEARDWFVRNYGGYLNLLGRSCEAPYFKNAGCTVLCHIVWGTNRRGTYFVQMAILPAGESPPIKNMLFPLEFLTPQERRVTGL
jgi:hypothetical protein